MKLPPESLAWRVVRYKRSGIHRAQRLPRCERYPRCNQTEEQARTEAFATNMSRLRDAVRIEADWLRRRQRLERHIAHPDTRKR